MTVACVMHRIRIPVVFPCGVSVGGERLGNSLRISRDGRDRTVVRGSSWAGVLRRELCCSPIAKDVALWFGGWLGDRDRGGRPSDRHITIHDAVLRGASGSSATVMRTHNAVDRHDGAPVDGALFTLEAAAPGATCSFEAWIKAFPEDQDRVADLVRAIVDVFTRGIMVGGSKARGIGEGRLAAAPAWHKFDLREFKDRSQWLDVRSGGAEDGGERMPLLEVPSAHSAGRDLDLTVEFTIPPGQDLLCGAGQVGDLSLDVQRVVDANGVEWFRLPGSSLRGIMRGWCARLAAREGKPVAYSHAVGCENRMTGEQAANLTPGECVVTDLFGSANRAGRVHVSDALVRCDRATRDQRAHVSIDRAWATSREGMLFQNGLLTAVDDPFAVRIRVRDVAQHEAVWIARTLFAIKIGLVRIGSSKSSGRLDARIVQADGRFNELVGSIVAGNGGES